MSELFARGWRCAVAAALVWCTAAQADDGGASEAARVLFVSGQCHWSLPGGAARVLTKDQRIPVGARIEAGADGRVYLGTADNGFLALRPGTAARIARYDAVAGGRVDIRLELERGTARVVSGAAAQRERGGFRLETPQAVVGVRGTDFSVRTDAEATQVGVRRGGVVVSPLSETCRAGAPGPCEGTMAMELFAREAGLMVEVRRGSTAQKLPTSGVGPDDRSPPGPGEGRSPEADRGRPTQGLADGGEAAVRLEAALTETVSGTAATPSPPPSPPPAPTVFWGRWAGSGNNGQTDRERFRALAAGREVVAANTWFALTRTPGTPSLPREGQVTLGLAAADAMIVSQQGAPIAAATVSDASLMLDFSRQRFETALTTVGGGHSARFRGAGSIYPNGTFESFWQQGTNGTIIGAIEPGARGAAYIYSQPISGTQAVATGVTSWVR